MVEDGVLIEFGRKAQHSGGPGILGLGFDPQSLRFVESECLSDLVFFLLHSLLCSLGGGLGFADLLLLGWHNYMVNIILDNGIFN